MNTKQPFSTPRNSGFFPANRSASSVPISVMRLLICSCVKSTLRISPSISFFIVILLCCFDDLNKPAGLFRRRKSRIHAQTPHRRQAAVCIDGGQPRPLRRVKAPIHTQPLDRAAAPVGRRQGQTLVAPEGSRKKRLRAGPEGKPLSRRTGQQRQHIVSPAKRLSRQQSRPLRFRAQLRNQLRRRPPDDDPPG